MDLAQMYMASPDWIKLMWITLPLVTVYGIARLWMMRGADTSTISRVRQDKAVKLPGAQRQDLPIIEIPPIPERPSLTT